MTIHHTYCVTYCREDGEETFHSHADAMRPEEAALMSALEAAQNGIDVSDLPCRVMVILQLPPDLKMLVRMVKSLGLTVVEPGISQDAKEQADALVHAAKRGPGLH